MKLISNSPQETINFGLKLAKKAKGGDIFALIGGLGGGKTCFTKGFAKGLDVRHAIHSPSFTLMKIYNLKQGKKFCHVDIYRLKRPGEILEVGLKEHLGKKDVITVIEWADKIKKVLLPYKKTEINFSFIDKNSRKITIKSPA